MNIDLLFVRFMIGAAIAALISLAAFRTRSLAASGASAATLIGAATAAAGWGWGALLVTYFVASSLLTRMGRDKKRARTQSVLGDSTARNALQVIANGGFFAAFALIGTITSDVRWHIAALGALAAATADTWATEIGTLWGGTPRSILTARPVPVGESGGVTLIGFLGAIAGSAVIAATAPWILVHEMSSPLGAAAASPIGTAVFTAGIGGCIADSLIGLTLQAKRWCDSCNVITERDPHSCGGVTGHVRGVPWVTNDAVNIVSTLAGAVLALALSGALVRSFF